MKIHWLVIALIFSAFYLWRSGFFLRRDTPLDHKVAGVRGIIWCASIVIVAWPLQYFRAQMGSATYLAIAFAIIGVFYGAGILAARALVKRQDAQTQ